MECEADQREDVQAGQRLGRTGYSPGPVKYQALPVYWRGEATRVSLTVASTCARLEP
jgi:hypothetical protein